MSNMNQEEHVLALSDVVHDETIDDESSHEQQTTDSHRQARASDFDTNNDLMSPLHDNYSVSEHSEHHIGASESYAVAMLEREISSLLNQNASAATAALLTAAAQQRQANIELGRDGEPLDGTSDNMGGLGGLGLSGLAAVLQAVHAQGLSGLSSRPVDQQDSTQEQKTTRTAPAFHSLTAAETSDDVSRHRGDGMGGVEGSDYLFQQQDNTNEREDYSNQDNPLHHSPSPHHQSEGVQTPSNELPSGGGVFSNIDDILNQFSAQFDPDPTQEHRHDLSPTDSPPVISHVQQVNTESPEEQVPMSPPPTLKRNSRQPVASTSYTPPLEPPRKRSKKGSPKDKTSSHICEEAYCQKSFTRRSDLARHRRIHTGERPFICSYGNCGKTFIQRSALHVHARVHTGEKPHACEYPACGKTFGDSSSLARHRRTHTGKRPYKCEDLACEKTFTRRTTLTAHMRTHDPNWEPDPNVKYNFKGKKRKVLDDEDDDDDDEDELAENVRTISALFQAGSQIMPHREGESDEPLEARVASISAEIAAAIAQAHSRGYDDDEEEDEEEEESGSGQEIGGMETIGPNTSGIRGVSVEQRGMLDKRIGHMGRIEEEDDSDAFPVPLRARKLLTPPGSKRKR